MRLTRLSVLLSLPAAILSFVVYPEAEVFQVQPGGDSGSRSPKQISRPVPQAVDGEDASLEFPTPEDIALEIIADEWIKITKLSPKYISHAKSIDGDTDDQPLPVVIWHGLGDSADAKGLKEV